MKMKINMNKCRVCLENIGVIPFFQDHANEIVSEMISSLFNIDVIYDESLPTTICLNCLENIKLCLLTKTIIVNSESMLSLYLKSNTTIGESAENLNQTKFQDEEDPVALPELNGLEANEIIIETSDEESSRDFEDEQPAGFQIINVQSLTTSKPQMDPTASVLYDCEFCEFRAVTYKRLISHKQIHSGINSAEKNSFDSSLSETQNITQREKCCVLFKSTKGKLKLNLDGFSFNKLLIKNDLCYWACEKRLVEPNKCNAKCITKIGTISAHKLQKETGHHNHDPNAMTIGVANTLTDLKDDASKNERKRVCQMVQDLVSRSTDDIGSNLPSTRAMRQIVSRTKNKQNTFPKEPENLKFHLDVNFIKEKDKTFVALDEFFDDQRVIVITNLQFVNFLGCAKYWMLDGTFKIVPSIFKQLYTIHADVNGSKAFPLAFGLCSAKSESIYDKMFQMLIDYAAENNVKLEPKLSITDFEKAVINSLKNHFSDIQTEGCHFHLGQIIYRCIQAMGFTSKYGHNEDFSLKMRAVFALSFISSANITSYFDKLFEVLDDDGRKVATWFSENYIYGKNNRPPQFSPSFWSCFNRNLKNLPRTQNFAESWHHRIHKIIDAEHVGVYKIINELHKEIIFIKTEIGKYQSGAPPPSKKTKYIQKEIRISRILENKTQYNELEFLLALAKNMRLQ